MLWTARLEQGPLMHKASPDFLGGGTGGRVAATTASPKRLNRNELTKALTHRSYFSTGKDEPFQVIKILNTYVMVTGRDLSDSKERTGFLKLKIWDAVRYAVSGHDRDVLDKIGNLRPENTNQQHYMLYALFMYLAGEAAIDPVTDPETNKPYTFLSACRKAGMLDMYDRRSDAQKFTHALQLLGLWERTDKLGNKYIQNLLADWVNKGSFTVVGLPHDNGILEPLENGLQEKKSGVFPKLVESLSGPKNEAMRTSNCISFLVAMIDKLKDVTGSSERETEMLKIISEAANNSIIAQELVAQGEDIKFDTILEAIMSAFADKKPSAQHLKRSTEFFTELYSGFDEETLRLLYYSNHSTAVTTEPNLKKLWPVSMPGVEDDYNNLTRQGKGATNARYRVVAASIGIGNGEIDPAANDKLKQTSVHETLHVAINVLMENYHDPEFNELRERAVKLGDEVYNVFSSFRGFNPATPMDSAILQQKSGTLNEKLFDVINPHAFMYQGYDGGLVGNSPMDKKREEVLANLLGLIYTEYAEGAKFDNNPFLKSSVDDPALVPLQELTAQLQRFYIDVSLKVEEKALQSDLSVSQPAFA